jgi:hypothetical protein
MKSLVEGLAFFDFMVTFSHSLGFTALLLLDMVALILVISSTSSLIDLDGRWG